MAQYGNEGIFLSLNMMKDDKGTTSSSSRRLLDVISCVNFLLVYLETSFMCYINLWWKFPWIVEGPMEVELIRFSWGGFA
jgi:hypothetical protein